jgi:hypothetical protein
MKVLEDVMLLVENKCYMLLQVIQNKTINLQNKWNTKDIAQYRALLPICSPYTVLSTSVFDEDRRTAYHMVRATKSKK